MFSWSFFPSTICRHPRNFVFAIAAGLVLAIPAPVARAAVATTTQLSIPVPSVAVGVPTLLVATVTDASNNPVLKGTVTFYDGSRALGSVQIVSLAGGSFTQGTANFKTASFTPGANSITAVFAGTKTDSASTSAPTTVTVTGKNATATPLTFSVSGGEYTLTSALRAFGAGVPTGSLDFLNLTTDESLGTVPLTGASWKDGFFFNGVLTPGYLGQQGMVAGDFNGDGFLDLATCETPGDGVGMISVSLGNGDGTFKSVVTYPATNSPSAIYAGDFNNDGKLDLAVVTEDGLGEGTTLVGIFIGNGDGTFQPQTNYGSVLDATSAAIADFDRDGNLDIAVNIDEGPSGYVVVMLGNGDGTFKPAQFYEVGLAGAIVAGDLNGDGIPDLLVNSSGETFSGDTVIRIYDTLSELIGKGDGTFNPYTTVTVGDDDEFGSSSNMTLVDLSGDGKLDLVYSDNGGKGVGVALGKGDGTFEPDTTYPFFGEDVVGAGISQLVIADVNQDGKADIAVAAANFVGSTFDTTFHLEVLLGKGDGTLQPATSYFDTTPDSSGVSLLITGDFNGDGRPDLVSAGPSEPIESVFLGDQTASLQLASVAPPASASAFVEASYSGDDFFAASSSASVQLGSSITAATTELQFGTINFGSTATLPLTITNVGAAPGTLMVGSSINEPSYKVLTTAENTCLAGVASGHSCTLPVEFSPVTVGTHNDVLTLTVGGAAVSSVRLLGVASGLGATIETPLEFGSLPIGATEVLPLTITNFQLSGASLIPYSSGASYKILTTEQNTCQGTIWYGQSCVLPIEFSPATVGVHNDIVTLLPLCCNAVSSTVSLHGIGTATGVAAAMQPLQFGTIPFGSGATVVLPLTVTNFGVPGTVVVEAASNGPSYKVLTTGNTCLAGITAGESCVLPVEFAPVIVGIHDDFLILTPSGGAAASTAGLTGDASGVGATIERPLEFGTIPVGTTKVLPLTILNHGVPGAITIGATTSNPSYTILTTPQNTCTGTIPAGQSCILPIQFAPTAGGGYTDSLTITPSGGVAASTVALNGTASP